ncbi:C6 zinc finger domain protein [Colletotrichum truncatum]|uniref:C6 zinc finger domain protein n=1 Tax=Colletotrichum truncatum TaxID=5467 RepID=A0ACC3YZ91_COLTU|nr:C6 zinc finger domain protein [Colletotrichum truncatum]KAF6786272.1 C6 zinc finger domain protein [Colletotrichum truncatum]
MRPAVKIPKACEPCRRRKIKCSGDKPCQQCGNKPSDCMYRLKPRVRLSAKRSRSVIDAEAEDNVSTPAADGASCDEVTSRRLAEDHQQQVAQTEVYHSVAAAHHAPKSTDSSQLFYGPSSNSAFLQQVHRGLLSGQYRQTHNRDVLEGGPGLDMFMQRNIFFGIPLKVNIEPAQPTSCPVSIEQAREFVHFFKITHLSTLPFFSASEMDEILPMLFNSSPDTAIQPQRKTVLFAALALGALSTPQTDAAESLFIHAKKEAAIYEDAVTLPMIQYSMLMAHYQLNMGRPNSAYLHTGVASRKALAMGLHIGTTSAISRNDEVQARLITIWSLYFLEIWLGLVVGRRSMVGKSDFAACPFPDNQPTMVALCQFATIVEDAVESIYNRRTDSLRQLYGKAEKLHSQVRQYGDKWALGSAIPAQKEAWNAETSLLLHNVYFHVILLIFRPFLIAEAALQSGNGAARTGDIWLRQACRHATDAAQDAIAFTASKLQGPENCNTRRYIAFFIESCCAVLLYDSLRHPAKHPHNLEYIQMAISCLHSLVGDDPVTNALRSIKRIVWAVENSIHASRTNSGAMLDAGSTDSSPSWSGDRFPTSIQFPSLEENRATTSDDLIYFSNRPYREQPDPPAPDYTMPLPGAAPGMNPFPDLNFDVLTTDLFNFFPIDMNSTPSAPG